MPLTTARATASADWEGQGIGSQPEDTGEARGDLEPQRRPRTRDELLEELRRRREELERDSLDDDPFRDEI